MKTRLLAILLLAGATVFAGPRVFVGFGVAAPAPAVAYYAPPPVAYMPPAPGPGYSWVAGYYYPVGPRRVYRPGYWARPPYARSYRVAPGYYNGHHYGNSWRR